MPSPIRSCSERHSYFISSQRARAASVSPRSSASIARSIVGRDISPSSSSVNQRSGIAPPARRDPRSEMVPIHDETGGGAVPKVLYEKRDRIAYVTLNRPEARNAVDWETHHLLWEAWEDFAVDDAVDVAILTGAGDGFCAGAALKTFIPEWIQNASANRVRENVKTGLGGLTRGLHRIYKPVIGAINGWALAGGLEPALACDIRIASERAMFGSFEARRGYHHGDGGIVRLVNACGTGVASHMLLTAEPVDAQQALAWQMVTRVVPHERLMEEAELVARQILRNSQRAVRSAKETIAEVIGQDLDAQLRIEAWNAYTCADTEETLGRLQQFYDRTDPGRVGA